MSSPVVRFAPSPTGRIHIGNARTALLNYLFARRHGGTFVLRFDDTDAERSREEFITAIETDLAWLGIVPDLSVRQSQRFALYEAAAQRLQAEGRLYPCYETPDELERRRKRQIARGLPPVYDRAALALTPDERAALERDGRRPHWRFKLEPTVVRWDDLVRGPCHIDCASLSDPVLRREDGSWLYTLPSVVDDVDLGVTHVIRGEDHVTNTAVQLQLFAVLCPGGRAAPTFAHHNLLTDMTGEGLSKRSGALSIGGLHDAGIEALAVAALAVLTGSSDAVHPVASLRELSMTLDFSHISRAAAKFDPADLATLSARTLHILPFECVRARLAAHDITGHKAEPFWLAVRGNLELSGRRRLVARRRPRHRAGRRGPRFPAHRTGAPAERALDRGDVGPVDRRPQARDRPQGQGPVSPFAAGTHRPRQRARTIRAAAAHRVGQSIGPTVRTFRLTPSGPVTSRFWPSSAP